MMFANEGNFRLFGGLSEEAKQEIIRDELEEMK